MSVVIETTLGDITVDLFLHQRPVTCLNFLKLCKMKYYNFNLFHSIRSGFIAQTGDPTGEGTNGESIFGLLEGPEKRFFSGEKLPKIRHTNTGTLSMVCTGDMMVGSQFFFTLAPDLDSLDSIHCVIGEVTEGHDVLRKLNDVICDESHRPYRDVRITHTVILEDPFNDPSGLRAPSRSPSPSVERLKGGRIAPDEDIDEAQGKSAAEIQEIIEEKEAKARATILEIVGDLPDADIAPPENVLFVCKLNPVTTDEDLEIIFSRFGTIVGCEVIRDKKTGDSLQYAFVEFSDKKSCEEAYFKMDNVLIDDRRIHVDFSQSVSKMRYLGKGRGVQYLNDDEKQSSKDLDKYKNGDDKNGKYKKHERETDRNKDKHSTHQRHRSRERNASRKKRSRSRTRRSPERSRNRKDRSHSRSRTGRSHRRDRKSCEKIKPERTKHKSSRDRRLRSPSASKSSSRSHHRRSHDKREKKSRSERTRNRSRGHRREKPKESSSKERPRVPSKSRSRSPIKKVVDQKTLKENEVTAKTLNEKSSKECTITAVSKSKSKSPFIDHRKDNKVSKSERNHAKLQSLTEKAEDQKRENEKTTSVPEEVHDKSQDHLNKTRESRSKSPNKIKEKFTTSSWREIPLYNHFEEKTDRSLMKIEMSQSDQIKNMPEISLITEQIREQIPHDHMSKITRPRSNSRSRIEKPEYEQKKEIETTPEKSRIIATQHQEDKITQEDMTLGSGSNRKSHTEKSNDQKSSEQPDTKAISERSDNKHPQNSRERSTSRSRMEDILNVYSRDFENRKKPKQSEELPSNEVNNSSQTDIASKPSRDDKIRNRSILNDKNHKLEEQKNESAYNEKSASDKKQKYQKEISTKDPKKNIPNKRAEKDSPLPKKEKKKSKSSKKKVTKIIKKKKRKHSTSSSSDSSDSSTSTESSSSSSEDDRKKKPIKRRKKKVSTSSSSSDSTSSSSSSSSSSTSSSSESEPSKKKRKKVVVSKASKTKKGKKK